MFPKLMAIVLMVTRSLAIPPPVAPFSDRPITPFHKDIIGYPYHPNDPTCIQVANSVGSWTVEKFDYHADYMCLVPDAVKSVKSFLDFDIVNSALDYKAKCRAYSQSLPEPFVDDNWWPCRLEGGASNDTAFFRYTLATKKLEINQTWSCPKEPGGVKAIGSVTVNTYDCTDITTTNNVWRKGLLYSSRQVVCPVSKFSTPIKNVTALT